MQSHGFAGRPRSLAGQAVLFVCLVGLLPVTAAGVSPPTPTVSPVPRAEAIPAPGAVVPPPALPDVDPGSPGERAGAAWLEPAPQPPVDGDLFAWLRGELSRTGPASPRAPLASTDCLEAARRDQAAHRALADASATRGGETGPEAVARVCAVAVRHPAEFREVVRRAARAGETAGAMADLEEALEAFYANDVLRPRDAGALGYAVARLLEEDRTPAEGGRPLFHQPRAEREGAEPPGGRTEGDLADVSRWFPDLGPPWGMEGIGLGASDLPWSGHEVEWGEGIEGLGDEDAGGETELGDPIARAPRPPSPETEIPGGSELPPTGVEGPYGGLNIQVARVGQLVDDDLLGDDETRPGSVGEAKRNDVATAVTVALRVGGQVDVKDDDAGVSVRVHEPDGSTTLYHYDPQNDSWTYVRSAGPSMPGPGEAGEGSDVPLRLEPQLLMKAEREAERQGPAGRPGGAIDPRPVREATTPEGGLEKQATGPAGAAGTEQKRKFAGRKPGSGVTDYPEWGVGRGTETAVRHDPGQVTDPAEPEAAVSSGPPVAAAQARQRIAANAAPVGARLLADAARIAATVR
jgi:hypothetical protein